MNRILVFGKNGQIGWELRRTMSPLGHVVALDRRSGDLGDPDSIRASIRHVRPRVIVNAAAFTAVDKAEDEREIAMAINGVAPGIIAEEAKRAGALLIHYSTDYVFDGKKRAPYDEGDAPCPLNEYGRSKLAGEGAVKAIGGDYMIFRTSWVYGWRGRNFLLTMLRLASARSDLRVVDDQVGSPTWSRIIAEASAQVAGRALHQPGWLGDVTGTYNLSSDGQTTWYEFAKLALSRAADCWGWPAASISPISTKEYPLPAVRPLYSVLSKDRIANILGLRMIPWADGLEMCLDELFAARPKMDFGA